MNLSRTWCFAVVFTVLGNFAFSQTFPAVSTEITALGKKASDSRLSEAEKKEALETMARLYELSGSVKEAAETWEKAAVQGAYSAMLQSARCYTAIGEFDKANAMLKPVLAAQSPQLVKARLLSAWIEAFNTGRTEALNALASNPDFAAYKPGIYYTIWRITGNTEVKAAMSARLLAEFPQSPEARIIRDDSRVSAVPTALWILSVVNFTAPAIAVPEQAGSAAANPAAQNGSPVILQTGIFSREENARILADRLKKAGFSPMVSQKTVRGETYWVVGVAPGSDPVRTTLLLKDKGFESFPVFEK